MEEKALQTLIELFKDTDVTLETIRQIYAQGVIKTYDEGVTLCHEGQIEETLYILLEGQVDIYRFQNGDYHIIDRIKPGNCFGELALIMNVPRTADVVTTLPVRVIEINRTAFNEFIKGEPQALLAVAQLVIQRMLTQETRRLIQLSRQYRAENHSSEVFISYARKDEGFVRRLASDLRKHHIKAWVDVFEIEAGQSWARQIGKALDACKSMVLVLSSNAVDSENVEDEWNYYLDQGKPIVPILKESCHIPYRLYKLHYIDFVQADYEDALVQLVASLRTTIKPDQD